jgi:hypothetical protein
MLPTKEELWAKFDALGEDKVRENLAAKRYGERNEPMAREWLRQQEAKRANESTKRSDNVQERQIKSSGWLNVATWSLVAVTLIGALILAAATLVD